ncbi:methionine--tRNA ligase [Bradyrhizobium guangdongense]|uniref:Methionine--tRNA ligase n=1 Tax=Bradyrhizobium guangdongense TaxID=1325090 RepID=A0A410V7B0_9BRAD|nr:methionine--tRNA ligase [Bradyrhizobium guangdongense]QAU39569.1 methionine--tRNA ligase [Bradyrhizobium guangdongense]QOZ60630.1 methionine--tRNA ligase [Bradyrhizobium guangdongense]GGI24095.1 methionine--tRNA ligase [Bradyrhizobium guangdongense]
MATRAKKTVKGKSGKKAAKKSTKKTAKRAVKARVSKAAKKVNKVKKSKKAAAKKGVKTSAAKPTKKAAKKQAVTKKTAAKKAVKKSAKAPAKTTAKKARVSAPPPAVAPSKVVKPKVAKAKTPPAPKPVTAPKPAASARDNVFYISTAIAYPNGAPHIGHAYEAISADVLARFARLDGKDVFFLTGTDEHGQKMVQTAQNESLTPSALATRNAGRFKEMDERLNVSFDRFIRTTEEQHHRSSQEIWRRMEANGDIYLDSYSGWYSVRDEAYYAEDETRLNDDGVRLGPQGTPVEWVEEKSYFFRLSAYQDKLLKLYTDNPDFIGPDSRRNEVVSFVKGGLRDLSISRTTFDWGVKVPGDEEHVMYVWVDALTNYITGVGFPDESDKNWRYWPADVHIIGKDIIRFHAVYWPAFLLSAGIALPKRIYAHGFLFNRGEKMSKSVGNVVDPFNLADQYGVDQMRYFFLREVSYGQDGNYNHEAIVARINADLANDLGNLAQRSLSMIAKQLGGVLPEPGAFSDNDKAILAMADGMIATSREAMSTQQIHHWLNAVWAVVAEANRYFAGEAPWALAKTDPVRQKTVLYVTAEVVRQIAILAQPAMPVACGKLLDSLGIPEGERNFAVLGGDRRIAPGSTLPAPTPAFPRYVEPAA